MKIRYMAVILLFTSSITKAVLVGFFPGLPKLIESADAIVILRVEKPLDNRWGDTGYSTYECYIYQTLKGKFPENSRVELQLFHFTRIASSYQFGSRHLVFLINKLSENEPTDYRMLTTTGSEVLLSPLGHEKMPEGDTVEEQVRNLIKEAINYQTEENTKRKTFLKLMINDLRGLEQLPEGFNFRLSGYDVVPLPINKTSEMYEAFRLDADIDLSLIYQALIGPNTTLRAKAAKYLGIHGNKASIPYLIDELSDGSSHGGSNPEPSGMSTTRYWANDSLKRLTGEDFGFVWDDPVEKRQEAIKKWQAWYLKTLNAAN